MSAAEKLRALEPWLAKGSSREVIMLVDALPQIVAVVELAEQNVADYDKHCREQSVWTSGSATTPWLKTRAALAALDRALS